MPHPDWCGCDCASCTKHCALDERIPCSPGCMNSDVDGELTLDCLGCDAPKTILQGKIMYFPDDNDALYWCERRNCAATAYYCEQECNQRYSCEIYELANEYTQHNTQEEEEE